MPTINKSINITLRGHEVNELIFRPAFYNGTLSEYFDIKPNIDGERMLAFIGNLKDIVRRYNNCGWRPTGNFELSTRCLRLNRVEAQIEQCADEFFDTIFEQLLKKGSNIMDLEGTQIAQIMQEQFVTAIQEHLLKLAFFGDRAVADPTLNSVDGIISVLIPELINEQTINYEEYQTALTSENVIDAVRQVIDKQNLQMKGMPNGDKQILVSGTTYEKLVTAYEDMPGCCSLETLQDGITVLRIRGFEVKPLWLSDQILGAKDFILMYVKGNMVVGTDIINPGSDYRIFTDPKPQTLCMDAKWKFGVDYIHPNMFSIGAETGIF